jgi:ribonuclease HI
MVMAKTKGPKFYAVAVGRVAGIYNTWDECKAQVRVSPDSHQPRPPAAANLNCNLMIYYLALYFYFRRVQTSGYSGAVFKGFTTRHEAQAFCTQAKSSSAVATATASGIAAGMYQGRKRSREDDVAVASNQQEKATKLNYQSPTLIFLLQVTIHFDGGSRGNPGVAGAGAEVVVVDHSKDPISTTTYSVREYCGERATNNYAEYKGLLSGLRQAKSCIERHASRESSPKRPLLLLQVYGDSNLIIQQLRGSWKCKHPNIVPLFDACQSILGEIKKYDTRSVVAFDHVYREHNKVADGERLEEFSYTPCVY